MSSLKPKKSPPKQGFFGNLFNFWSTKKSPPKKTTKSPPKKTLKKSPPKKTTKSPPKKIQKKSPPKKTTKSPPKKIQKKSPPKKTKSPPKKVKSPPKKTKSPPKKTIKSPPKKVKSPLKFYSPISPPKSLKFYSPKSPPKFNYHKSLREKYISEMGESEFYPANISPHKKSPKYKKGLSSPSSLENDSEFYPANSPKKGFTSFFNNKNQKSKLISPTLKVKLKKNNPKSKSPSSSPKTKDSPILETSKSCKIPEVYCGNGEIPSSGGPYSTYVRKGTPYECLKKGIGTGVYANKNKERSPTSVQNIKYVGEKTEEQLRKKGIDTLNELVNFAKGKSEAELTKFLKSVCVQSNGVLNQKAFNAIIIYLKLNKVSKLPDCYKITKI